MLRIWKANAAIKRELGLEGIVPMYVTDPDLDKLARDYPQDYIGRLESWMHTLFNQTYYRATDIGVDVAASRVNDGTIECRTFVCEKTDLGLRIMSVKDGFDGSGWKSVKSEGRRKCE